MLRRVLLVIAIVVLALPFVGVAAQDGNIVDVATSAGNFTTLLQAVSAADPSVAAALAGEGPLTVFAPTDDAFAALPAGVLDYLMAHPDLLTQVLLYHVVDGAVDAASTEATTLQGTPVAIASNDMGLTVDGIAVSQMDIAASNGVIDAVDAVLLPPIDLPAMDALSVTGDIIGAGSSTVGPLTQNAIEAFIDAGYSGSITNDIIGSGAGFERFCTAGETDISNASRAIKTAEIEACAALTPARVPFELYVGIDAITVVVSAENDFLTDLSIAQLASIFSGAVTTWDQVDASYPAEPIQAFAPGSDSGTYDYFLEVTLEASTDNGGLGLEAEAAEAAIQSVPGIQFSEDDNVLVQGVVGSPYAIGFFGYAYYVENQSTLKALSINGVTPTATTAESGEYPLARPLFVYSDGDILAGKPQVADFLNFYLSNLHSFYTGAAQYFPTSERTYRLAKLILLAHYPTM